MSKQTGEVNVVVLARVAYRIFVAAVYVGVVYAGVHFVAKFW